MPAGNGQSVATRVMVYGVGAGVISLLDAAGMVRPVGVLTCLVAVDAAGVVVVVFCS